MGSCNSGSKASGNANANQLNSLIDRVNTPQSKDDYLLRLKVIAEVGEAGYNTVVSTSDWNNYGKSRTYLKIDAYREIDGKFHHSRDYGYYDNNSGNYVTSKRSNDLDGKMYGMKGSSISDDEMKTALQALMKRGEA